MSLNLTCNEPTNSKLRMVYHLIDKVHVTLDQARCYLTNAESKVLEQATNALNHEESFGIRDPEKLWSECWKAYSSFRARHLDAILALEKEENKKVLQMTKAVLEEWLKLAGGCEHSVNICVCHEARVLEMFSKFVEEY